MLTGEYSIRSNLMASDLIRLLQGQYNKQVSAYGAVPRRCLPLRNDVTLEVKTMP